MGEPPLIYSCPPWSPVNTTPGKTCRYWAKSGSPPIAGISLISFGVILVTDTFTSVFISCLSADTVTVSICTDEGEISNFRLSICWSFSVIS